MSFEECFKKHYNCKILECKKSENSTQYTSTCSYEYISRFSMFFKTLFKLELNL